MSERLDRIVAMHRDGANGFEISRVIGIDRSAVYRYLHSVGITGRQYGYLPALTTRQKAVLIGTMLGDGCLARGKATWNAQLSLAHCKRQLGYLTWKVSELQPLFRAPPHLNRVVLGDVEHWTYQVASRPHPILTEYHSLFYGGLGGKKRICADVLARLDALGDQLPLALAVWYMDDGSLHKNQYVKLALGLGDDEEQYRLVVRWLVSKGFTSSITSRKKNYRSLYLGVGGRVSAFFSAIAPHVHPDMRYKLPSHLRAARRAMED